VINIRVVQLGRGLVRHEAAPDTTVGEVLAAVGIAPRGMEVRVGGRKARSADPLKDGDLITVIPLIKGGTSNSSATGRTAGEEERSR